MSRAKVPLAEFELAKKEALHKALVENKWNVMAAARQLGIGHPTAYRLVVRYGLMKKAKVMRNGYVKI